MHQRRSILSVLVKGQRRCLTGLPKRQAHIYFNIRIILLIGILGERKPSLVPDRKISPSL